MNSSFWDLWKEISQRNSSDNEDDYDYFMRQLIIDWMTDFEDSEEEYERELLEDRGDE